MSGCGTQLYATHAAQNFTSPNYPENYPSSTTCEWVITVSEGHRIQLSFPFIDLEEHGACVWDNLMIYDGWSYMRFKRSFLFDHIDRIADM